MRVRVRFRYEVESGEVVAFVVEDVGGRRTAADHDAQHDRVTAELARLVEQHALIEEFAPGTRVATGATDARSEALARGTDSAAVETTQDTSAGRLRD